MNSSSMRPGITLTLVARNEAKTLQSWFEHIIPWVDECIVVDSSSTDTTAEIARSYADHVVTVANRLNFDINKNYAFSLGSREWILSLDADEYPDEELLLNIRSIANANSVTCNAYEILMRHFALGQEITTPSWHLRLFRKGYGKFPEERVHQTIQVDGPVGRLEGVVNHYTFDRIFERMQKTNVYSEAIAANWYHSGKPFRVREMFLQSSLAFLRQYFRHNGYRRGILGFYIALEGSYSVMMRYIKLWSAYQVKEFPSNSQEFSD